MRKSKSGKKDNPITHITWASDNIFEDLGFSKEEAASLLMRSNLMIAIIKIIEDRRWTPAQAARALRVTEPRISELRQVRIGKFSVELLLKYLSRLNKEVNFSITDKVA